MFSKLFDKNLKRARATDSTAPHQSSASSNSPKNKKAKESVKSKQQGRGGSGGGGGANTDSREPSKKATKAERASREMNANLARLARAKQLAACRAAFTVGERRGVTDAWSHAILINAYATCGDGSGALKALANMRARGHRPCVMSFTAALKAPCTSGDLDEARRLLTEMEEEFAKSSSATTTIAKVGNDSKGTPRAAAATDVRGGNGDYVPNVRTANTFLRGCLVGGGVDDARALYRQLGDKGVWQAVAADISTFEYVGTLCAQALRLDEASKLAARALEAGSSRRSGEHAAARVLVAAARGAALAGEWKKCRDVCSKASKLLGDEDTSDTSAAPGGGGGRE